jgi:hypothetical protein
MVKAQYVPLAHIGTLKEMSEGSTASATSKGFLRDCLTSPGERCRGIDAPRRDLWFLGTAGDRERVKEVR